MKELSSILDILTPTTRPGVLATLVRVEGSSYRRVGARLLWSGDEPRRGAISGGCLEEDLIERARSVLVTGRSQTVIYDTTEENDLVWGVGLGCHGIVRVLLERIHGLPPVLKVLRQAWGARQAAAVVHVYQEAGPFALGTVHATSPAVAPDGSLPPAHPQVRALAEEALAKAGHVYASVEGAELFVEYLPPPPSLLVFGAGDDAIPLTRLAREMGWRVTVADPRSAFATAARFQGADAVHVLRPEDAASLPFDPWTVAVVMTHHYRLDVPALRALLPLNLPYLGLLGPRKRAERILSDLASAGFPVTEDMRMRLHAPVGLDLGGGTPEEVALSIVAEIQAVLSGRDGRALRERRQPIHA